MKNNKIFKKIIIFLILFIGLLSCFVFANNKTKVKVKTNIAVAQEKNDYLYLIEVNGKYGLKDKNGKIIISPIYDKVQETSEGLIVITKNNKLGLVNKKREILIKPTYKVNSIFSYQFHYSDGLAAVIKETKTGLNNCVYIDKTGKEVLDPTKYGYSTMQQETYGVCSDFSEGLAAATSNKNWGQYYGYIDKKGKLIIKIENVSDDTEELFPIGNFSEGLATVPINHKYGYIDATGKFVIDPAYNWAEDFLKGKARVEKDNHCFYINKKGKKLYSTKCN